MTPKNKTIKFARGFQVPTKDIIHKALKTINRDRRKKNKSEEILIKLIDHFNPLPSPTNNLDWLAQFREIGQTCQEFSKHCPLSTRDKLGREKFIYYVQIGEFKSNQINFADLIDYSRRFFSQVSIKIHPEVIRINVEEKNNNRGNTRLVIASLESAKIEKKLSIRYNEVTSHHQIQTDSLLILLKTIKPNDAYALIGLTEQDLYVEKSDLFVAGLCCGE